MMVASISEGSLVTILVALIGFSGLALQGFLNRREMKTMNGRSLGRTVHDMEARQIYLNEKTDYAITLAEKVHEGLSSHIENARPLNEWVRKQMENEP